LLVAARDRKAVSGVDNIVIPRALPLRDRVAPKRLKSAKVHKSFRIIRAWRALEPKIPRLDAEIAFDANGLVPCIVQDARSGEVLTLAYMNEEALARTRETGETHFFSRSRQELWHKGETSGNVQKVLRLRYDCDADALIALVDPAGPACHTGERTCFYRGDMDPTASEALATLQRTVDERKASPNPGSYTAELLADPSHIGEKVQEEAEEVARAAAEESGERVREEAADVLYHLTVLLAARGLSLADALEELNARRR
jgi:phosphoribosyl-ATP pyrophosphohydrolase/phosphoribosyl-AMP cyclohydrolase